LSWRKILPGTLLIVAACFLWAAPIVLIPKYRVLITSAPVARTTELMQFKVDVAGDYLVETVLPKGTTPFTMLHEVEVAKPGDPMFIGLRWTVYSDGRLVANGSSHQGTRPFSNDELAGQEIGTFHAERATPYVLQVRNDLISRTLMEARPAVRVVLSPRVSERLSEERWICLVAALSCGLIGAVWLIVAAVLMAKRGGSALARG
jgi:hypothetical protein